MTDRHKLLQLAGLGGLLLFAAGCTEETVDESGIKVPVEILTTVAEEDETEVTRAADGFNASTGFTISSTAADNKVGINAGGTDYAYTFSGTAGNATKTLTEPDTKPYFPAGSTSVAVYGWYPQGCKSSITVQTDQTSRENYLKSDLMLASSVNATRSGSGNNWTVNPASLTFKHAMAKISVAANAQSGSGITINSVTVTAKPTFSGYTPSSSTPGGSASGTATVIKVLGSGGGTGVCVIPPQDISGTFITVNATPSGGSATNIVYSLGSSAKTFSGNTVYPVTLTVGLQDISVGTVSITDWASQGNNPCNINPTTKIVNYVPFIGNKAILGALPGVFSVSSSTKVLFSQGNLRATYDGSLWTWSFAENQWDVIGGASGNTKINGDGTVSESNVTVDLFNWVGASSKWEDVAKYGICFSTNQGSIDTYGNGINESLKSDWGTLPISNGGNTANSGWRTLTMNEWTYVTKTRKTTSDLLYAKAKVNGREGLILLPDDWSASYYSLVSTNTPNASFTTNTISASDWTSKLAVHGCVFLPLAGERYAANAPIYEGGSVVGVKLVSNVNMSHGYYWSSSPGTANSSFHATYFYMDQVNVNNSERKYGRSVRLVRQVD